MATAERFRVNSRVVQKAMNEGSVLIDMRSGDCFELNRLGAQVWTRLGDGQSVSTLVAELSTEYGVPPQQVESDVLRLVAELVAHDLLHRA